METRQALFSPVRLGAIDLKHRVVMAPLTRSRSEQPGDLPGTLMREYYTQRASDGGLVVTEATSISSAARGWYGAPGLFTEPQVEGWKSIVAAVHAKGGKIVSQLWHTGRSSHISMRGGNTPGTASLNPTYWQDKTNVVSTPTGWSPPSPHRALTITEVQEIVGEYREAALRAKAAGFDGAEIHSANGYLLDQFLQDGSNHRTDEYGGSIPNRTRLLLEVTETVASVWGGNRTAVRLGPSGTFNGMSDSDPQSLFGYVAEQLNRFGLAYLHIIEPRVKGNVVVAEGQGPVAAVQLRKIFKGRIVAAGGFDADTAEAVVRAGEADAVAFGRHFIANPDLPERIRRGYPLARYNRDTFYTFDAQGYTDYPTYSATMN